MIIIKIIDLKKYEGRKYLVSFIVAALANLGSLFANVGSVACAFVWWDEEETPKSLIK